MWSDGERMLGGLLRASHLNSMDDLPDLVADQARLVGFTETMIYVADLQEQFLLPLPGQRDAAGRTLERIRIDSTLAGMAFRNVHPVPARDGPEWSGEELRLWVPMLDGTERVGVLGVLVPEASEINMWRANRLASLTALMVVSKRATSDTYTRLVRSPASGKMELSAEVLWNLLPPKNFADSRVIVSAALEPAYSVGGDAYDYAVQGDILHVSIYDAMGHDTAAGLTATVALGACRNNRRRGVGLLETSEAVDEAIAGQFAATRFATGILAALNTRTGRLAWVNRGHPPPLVLRGGRRVATLSSPPSPPMGFRLGLSSGLVRYQLEPGDRLLFYTDGIVEARSPDGAQFGLDRFTEFVSRREADGLPPPETLRRLIQAILAHQEGKLQDDATVLMVEWNTGRQAMLTL